VQKKSKQTVSLAEVRRSRGGVPVASDIRAGLEVTVNKAKTQDKMYN
jgi:hypothetical protein